MFKSLFSNQKQQHSNCANQKCIVLDLWEIESCWAMRNCRISNAIAESIDRFWMTQNINQSCHFILFHFQAVSMSNWLHCKFNCARCSLAFFHHRCENVYCCSVDVNWFRYFVCTHRSMYAIHTHRKLFLLSRFWCLSLNLYHFISFVLSILWQAQHT